nr:hypothetical protein [Tanacetum cinerariifolium]
MASRTGCAAGCFPFTYLELPIGGRLTLIKAVLGSLGIYYLSIFKAPEKILNSMESLRSRFFWGGSQDSRNMAWVKWSQVLSSFEKEGLQIGSLKAPCSPSKVALEGCGFNGTWSRIIGTSNFLHSKGIIPLNSFCFKVGCGTRVRFWKDIWIGYSLLHTRYNRLYRLDQDKDCLIIDRIVNGQWQWNWSSARRLFDSKLLPSIQTPTVWDKFLPRKVNIFLWRLSLDRLPHRLNHSSRGFDIPTISCSACNGNVESADHVFFECDLVKEIWCLVRKWLLKRNLSVYILSLRLYFGGYGDILYNDQIEAFNTTSKKGLSLDSMVTTSDTENRSSKFVKEVSGSCHHEKTSFQMQRAREQLTKTYNHYIRGIKPSQGQSHDAQGWP